MKHKSKHEKQHKAPASHIASMMPREKSKKEAKAEKVMSEFKAGVLRSGSKKGPVVKSRDQALAIALSESRKAGAHIPKKRK